MKQKIHTLSGRATALLLAVLLALPTAWAAAGDRKLQTTVRVVDGLTYRNTVTSSSGRRVESFSLELSPDSAAEPIFMQGSGYVYGAGSIKKAVSAAQEKGYHVLGAVNTDFFSMSTGVPIGIVVEDGVYRASSEGGPAILITDGKITLCEDPDVSLTLTNRTTGTKTEVPNLNKYRAGTGGLYLYNRDFSPSSAHTSTAGWYVRLKAAEPMSTDDPVYEDGALPALTVNSALLLEVVETGHTEDDIPLRENEYVLTADDRSGYSEALQSFQPGDRVELETACGDPALAEAQWAGGAGDVMIRNGSVTDSSNWTYAKDGRNPRTALGVKDDGAVLIYAVDGRKEGYSSGLSQADLADELLRQGCRWAVNLDGGGSTAMSVWLPGAADAGVQNTPSEGFLRSCATFLLLVTPEKGDGKPDRLAWADDGPVVLAGSSVALPETKVLDSGLNLLEDDPGEVETASENGLGTIEDGVYTAGDKAGTDVISLSSEELGVEGTAQIHVVEALTELTVTRTDSQNALSSLRLKPGETVPLSVAGSYWGREALRSLGAVSWTVEGNVGTVDENGLFTSDPKTGGAAGSIQVSAGGLTKTIPVTLANLHTDVAEDHWAYQAVEYCYDRGIVGGVTGTEYGRDLPIRRADFLLILYGALGKPAVSTPCDFSDVVGTDYYYTAVSWAQSAGLASGTGEGRYSPNDSLTREQAFTILRQAMPLMGIDCPDGEESVLDQFADKDKIAGYARPHTATLVAQGVVSGKGDGVDPKGTLTRAEMAVLIYKLLTYTPDEDGSTGKPGTEQPGTEQPGTEQPGTEQPGTQQPDGPGQQALTLDQTELTLVSAGSAGLTATLTPAAEGAAVTWTSSDPAAVTVNARGTVTNLSTRFEPVDVTVTASCNGLTASCVVHAEAAKQVGTVTGTETGLNIRSGPGTAHEKAGVLLDGDRAVVLNIQDGWAQILYGNKDGQAALGYVSAEYLTIAP